MSDFLSNLVNRSLGAAPVIQPRLPSLFEPTTPYALSHAATPAVWDQGRREAPGEAAFEDDDRVPAASQERPATSSNGRSEAGAGPELPPTAAHPSLAHEPTLETASRRTVAVPAPPRRNLPAGDFIAPAALNRSKAQPLAPAIFRTENENPERASSDLLEAQTDAPRQFHETDERRSEPVAVSAAPRRNLPAGDFIAPAVLNRSTAQRLAPAILRTKNENPERASSDLLEVQTDAPRQFHSTAESHAKSVLVESARSGMRDSAPRATAAIEPPGTPRFEFGRQVPPPLAASSQEPTIQVTIGRIEVRAVSLQASTPKERPASPVMSLNDYLRQRSKRGGA